MTDNPLEQEIDLLARLPTPKSAAQQALMEYQQADEEGIMVLTSRQAIHEVCDELDLLYVFVWSVANRPCIVDPDLRDVAQNLLAKQRSTMEGASNG